MSATQKLNFATAMSDFKNMFPHLDNTLIERVLRSNNGMVDQTIDDLLAISCEDTAHPSAVDTSPEVLTTQSNLLRPIEQLPATGMPSAGSPHVHPGPRTREYPTLSSYLPPGDLTLTPRSQQPAYQKYGQVPVTFLGVTFQIPYTDPLPAQFLKLSEPRVTSGNSPMASQMAEDREFALLLHNEEFLQQARNNQEFMRTLNQAERGGLVAPGVQATAAVESDVSPVSVASTSQTTDEVSITQRLSETGKATRSKLLKIAKKLNWRKSPALSSMRSSKLRQPLLGDDADEDQTREPLYNDNGDEGMIFDEYEEEEEEIKTIPRQDTINNFQIEHMRAREAVARQFRGERPPPPPVPPPQPRTSSTVPGQNSTLTRSEDSTLSHDDYHSANENDTLENNRSLVHSPNLLDLEDDPIYEEGPGSVTPIYASTEDLGDNVSKIFSDTSSLYGADCDVTRASEIRSATLSSSYLIPIRTFTDSDSEQYDNINVKPEANLIKF